ncbi:MAG TPA: carboxypeptidase-like regulatory domain-containing protein, partial [Terriglobia bacterium]|nr:carboxypeptidase-like regulatory domain-containing protein [Terriglobia bacterium]
MFGKRASLYILILAMGIAAVPAWVSGQGLGAAGVVKGTVKDATGAVIPDATVIIYNPVTGFDRTVSTDATGSFTLTNIPFNPYHLTAAATGFLPHVQDLDLNSGVPLNLNIILQVGSEKTTITVSTEASDLIEVDPTAHTDVDRALFDKLPLESASSTLSSLVTLSSPGVAADSNGLFHGFGDHASNSFSIDGQPITDQQSKVFSNQLPAD